MSGGNNKNIRNNNNNKRPSHTKQLGNDNDRLLQFFNVEGTKRKYLNNEQYHFIQITTFSLRFL